MTATTTPTKAIAALTKALASFEQRAADRRLRALDIGDTYKQMAQSLQASRDYRKARLACRATTALLLAHAEGTAPPLLANLSAASTINAIVNGPISPADFTSAERQGIPADHVGHAGELLREMAGSHDEDHEIAVADAIRTVRGHGKIAGFYPTPRAVADHILSLVPEPGEGEWVLEPSCGMGDLALSVMATWAGARLYAVEWNRSLHEVAALRLGSLGQFAVVHNDDFLAHDFARRFARIVMNPPFEKYQDADHVRRAYDLLAPDGYLVAIVSAVVMHGGHGVKKVREFQAWLTERGAHIERLDQGAFKASGTLTETCVVVLYRED